MSEEQVDFDTLYDKGFEEGITDVEPENTDEEETDAEETEEVDTEQPEEESEEDAEEESDETDDTESEEESEEDSDEPKHVIKYKGQELTLSPEELVQMAQKGFDYTAKTQDLSRRRAELELMEEKGLTKEDLALLADIKAGKKEALALVAQQAGIDPLDADIDESYKPKVSEKNYELEDVVSAIQADAENSAIIDQWLGALPQRVKSKFAENPAVLQGVYEDTRKGVSQKVMPEVIKELMINPNADFVETYLAVGNKVYKESPKEEAKPQASRSVKKKAAVSKSKKPSRMSDHQDVWEDDELYENMKKQLQAMR